MAGAPTMTANFDRTVTALVERRILDNLREVSRWLVPGAYIPGRLIPGTNLIRHIAYGDLPVDDPIIAVEGIAPDEEPLTIGYDEYAAVQRGRIIGVTDVALQMSPHELMAVAADKVSHDALMTVDRSVAAAVMAGTGITLTVAGAGVVAADVRRWVTDLKYANIPPFSDGFYLCMIHPDVAYDLQGDTSIGGWIEASKYADPSRLLNGEIGRMYGMRFIETTVGTRNAAATDTFNTVAFGPDYFAFGDLQSVETYMIRPGGNHADPLAQKALVGYKGMWGAKTLESASLVATGAGPRYGKVEGHAGTINRA
jgi:N4-gp56 family major capsid protein